MLSLSNTLGYRVCKLTVERLVILKFSLFMVTRPNLSQVSSPSKFADFPTSTTVNLIICS